MKKIKKLQLDKETITGITLEEMKHLRGGISPDEIGTTASDDITTPGLDDIPTGV